MGVYLDDSEKQSTLAFLFNNLKNRGLKVVDYIISDNHFGLIKDIKQNFQGSCWQRCQFHFKRNILNTAPRKHWNKISQILRNVLNSASQVETRKFFNKFIPKLEKINKKASKIFENGFEDSIAILNLPTKYQKCLRTTNMIERLSEEIRRRERVIRIFPNEDSALRLVGALIVEQHKKWITDQKYFNMYDYL